MFEDIFEKLTGKFCKNFSEGGSSEVMVGLNFATKFLVGMGKDLS